MSHHYLINLPHSATYIPMEYLPDYHLTKEDLQENIYQYADLFTDELYALLFENFGGVKAKYSRLLCDPERFFNDKMELMQQKFGLGWFYENAILKNTPLRSTKNKDTIATYYNDYHQKLNQRTAQKLEKYGKCTIIDCHSFSDEIYWFLDDDLKLPDICIGYEKYHQDTFLIETILNEFKEYEIGINEPYAGSLVPLDYWQKNSNVKSVMIEINKKLYLKDDNRTKSSNFDTIKKHLDNISDILQRENK